MSEKSVPDPQIVLQDLQGELSTSAEAIVPWYYDNMSEYYFLTHTEEEQVQHLKGIISGQVRTQGQSLTLRSPCGTRITHITPGGDMGELVKVLEKYRDKSIQAARIYSSKDDSLRLDTILLHPQSECAVGGADYTDALKIIHGANMIIPEKQNDFEAFLSETSSDYVDKFEAGRTVRHFETCECIEGHEQVRVELEKDVSEGFDRISLAMTNPSSKGLLLRIVKIFDREDVPVDRAYVDEFHPKEREPMVVCSFYIDQSRINLTEDDARWDRLARQLRQVKWFAFHGLEDLAEEEGWEIGKVQLMQAAAEFAHQFLISKDIHAYTSGRIVHCVLKHREIAETMFRYFEARFDPGIGGGRDALIPFRQARCREALKSLENRIERDIMAYIFRFFRFTLRTNYYLPTRFGLSFRMDPAILAPMPKEERPFAFFCFHGPHFFGFQVRYRDMARGGVRVVRTWSQEHFELESNRLFDEVTKLASAQQFKNKDIPEGGSKAVILLGPEGDIDLAVKSMVDSLLDLIVNPADEPGYTLPGVIDYLDREEIIYLGPDENITPKHIQWFVDRAAKRKYKWPAAFMSSKPRAGIGHKRYGVTSEGVIVFSDELLKTMGIDPKNEPFTVKITGGPAGDVASNVMKILYREYGENARIVAMSDGHGAAYDPEGFDYKELMRLCDNELKAADYNPDLIKGKGGFVIATDTPEGKRIRDELHNVVVADIFIPSGGRPDTINMQNWTHFLSDRGKPSTKGIVEGANIFISAPARAKLEQEGVLAVPGPSANKTGVICSSYEILAGLVITEDEFLAIKDEYVDQVLDILRTRARDEARLLMREYKLAAGEKTITELSYELSTQINELADTVVHTLVENAANVKSDPLLVNLIKAYCPAVLVEKYGDRITESVPKAHLIALLGANIASRIQYQEGMGWAQRLLESIDARDVIYAYLEQERRIAELVAKVRESGIEGREEIERIVAEAGRKRLTLERLGLA